MGTRLSLVLVVSLALAVSASSGEKQKSGQKSLEGTWKLVRGEKDGKPLPAEKIKGHLLVIDGDKIAANDPENKRVYVMTYKADASKKPPQIDMKISDGPDKGKSAAGIYALEGETLKLCYSLAGDRPKDFKTAEGDKHLCFEMTRIKTKKE